MRDIFDDTIGEGVGSDQPAEAVEQSAATPEPPAVTEPEAPTDPPADGDQGEQVQEPATPEPVELTDEDKEKLEQEVETALQDEKTPKWFKNAVENVYKPKIGTLDEQVKTFEPITQYGSVEEVVSQLEQLKGLNTIRTNPQTGMPEKSTEPFVKGLYEKDAGTAYQLISDLCQLPSPNTQGLTMLQEIIKGTGIDPAMMGRVKEFAANGYQLQASQYPAPDADDLAQIPQNLQSTFASLSPEEREEYLVMSDGARDAALENARIAREAQARETADAQTKTQREAQEKAQQDFAFRQQVNTKGFEHFTKASESVFTSFVDSLAKQANMPQMDALMITNTVLNSMEDTLAGRQSLEQLKAEGIEVDPLIQPTINQLQETSNHIAYFEAVGDKANVEKLVAKQVELQERLIAKGNKIIASLAKKRSASQATSINGQNAALASTQNARTMAAGAPSTIGTNNGNVDDDFTDEGYRAIYQPPSRR